jgi:hypothetical protein
MTMVICEQALLNAAQLPFVAALGNYETAWQLSSGRSYMSK